MQQLWIGIIGWNAGICPTSSDPYRAVGYASLHATLALKQLAAEPACSLH